MSLWCFSEVLLFRKINNIEKKIFLLKEHVVEVPDKILFHDVLKEECEKSVNSHVALKHIYQQVKFSIIITIAFPF